jgi:hypothetical protein
VLLLLLLLLPVYCPSAWSLHSITAVTDVDDAQLESLLLRKKHDSTMMPVCSHQVTQFLKS